MIKYEQGKPKQMLTQFFYFSTSAWFPQTATQIVYDMNSGSVNGFRAEPLKQES